MERDLLIRLVTGAQKGDSTAMDELFAAFYNDVYYFALKTVKDSDIACDITQETFWEIINTIGNLKEPAAFVTWMKQITYHQCTRYFRKKKDVLVEEDEDGNTIFDTLADESEDSIPSEVYEKQEFRDTILGIINELTEEQRSAVMMYYFDELSVGKIAEIQDVSEGTVKSRLNYARKAIKKSVENYEKKHNIKLHSFSFLPLFALFFAEEFMPAAQAAQIQTVVSAAASAAGAAAGGTAAGATAAAAGTGIMAKIAALPLVTKIIAGVAAAAVVIGGGAAAVVIGQAPASPEHPDHLWADCVDENLDCVCDICSAGIHFAEGERYFGEVAHDVFCDHCGASLGFRDADSNAICDVCGQFPCEEFHGVGHTDGNADGICEMCGHDYVHGDMTTQIEPKPFELQIEDKILRVVYPDGELDPNVDYYEMHIGELGITESFEGAEFDLSAYDTGDSVEVEISVYGVNAASLISPSASIIFEAIKIPAVPAVSIVTNRENAILTITPVDGAKMYEIYINGSCRTSIAETTFTVTRDMVDVGMNEICVRACNTAGYSAFSPAVTTGRLADPEYHATGTGVEVIWGDVDNAQGYIIYGDDEEYLTTIPLSGEYDFAHLYTEEGFYFPYIQAYGDGWISSKKCGIPVSIGESYGPIGN